MGREVEKIFVAVNTFSFAALSVSAEHLATRATKYGLAQIAQAALEIEKAAVEKRDQMQIVQLTSNLLRLCGASNDLHFQGGEEKAKISLN
jgi:hypothetical protein